MNEQLAEKFAEVLAKCAATGCSVDLRKEAADNKLIKEALEPIAGISPYAYMPAIGAAVSGLGGYLTTQDEKKKLRNAMYSAGIGGLVGLGAPAIADAFKSVAGGNSPLASVDVADPAIANNPAVQAAAAAAAADHKSGVPVNEPSTVGGVTARLGADAAAGGLAYRYTPGGRRGELGRVVGRKPNASNPAYQQLQEVLNARSKGTSVRDILHPSAAPLTAGQQATVDKVEKMFRGDMFRGNRNSLGTLTSTRQENLRTLEQALVDRAKRITPKGGPKLTGNQMNLTDFDAVRRGFKRRGAAGIGAAAATDAAIQWIQNYMARQGASENPK